MLLDNWVFDYPIKNLLVSEILLIADDTFFLEEVITISGCAEPSFHSIVYLI
jgi:hypothetical protein